MFYTQQWQCYIDLHRQCLKNGHEAVNDIQNIWFSTGYTCSICRCEVRYYEWMWHCKNKECKHDFCLSCINYMVQQYEQMQTLLFIILVKI